MPFRSLPVRLLLPLALMVLLAVLATLQYRWLGQVSEAERERMRASLSARASELAEEFDREVTRLFLVFQLPATASGSAADLSARLDVWRRTAKYPRLLSAIYLAPPPPGDSLQTLDVESRALEPAAWTDRLSHVRDQLMPPTPRAPGTVVVRIAPFLVTDAFVVAVPLPRALPSLPLAVFDSRLPGDTGYVLLAMDEEYIRGELLPSLVRQHLRDDTADYRVSIVDALNREPAIYATDAATLAPGDADVVSRMFSLRFALADRIVGPELRGLSAAAVSPDPHAPGGTTERVTVFVEQRAVERSGAAAGAFRFTGAGAGGWQLLLKHRAGSLEAAVARVRMRNLLMSFGMLALLAVSTGLVFVSARRAERLAAQQMDFVATVSHELRTPLAVIRSAGQNLADGVVHDAGQARRYGELIEGEGRRLTDMIEQTLALAGLSGDRRPLSRQPLDPAQVVRDVLESPDIVAAATGIDVGFSVGDQVPPVWADAMLVRRAVQNLVANALKYGGQGREVRVSVESGGPGRAREVRITVSDRGPGIDPRDLPHVFEPFYRGRDAVERQVQGNGLGLHLVKRIAEAHDGRATVKSSPGHGAAFTLHLPAHAGAALEPIYGPAPLRS